MATTSTATPSSDAPEKADASPVIPSLIFDNRTDIDALHFDSIDQHGTAFHVIVAKTAFVLGPCNAEGESQLLPLEEPAKLEVEDRHYEDDLTCGVRLESDLAPYKPMCDVIVNADAFAPRGKPARRFEVRLLVQRPDTPAPLPERPLPLNPLQGLSPAELDAWQSAVAHAKEKRIPGEILIDKTLVVTGDRALRKSPWPLRVLQHSVKLCTFGLIRPNPWRLTRPRDFVRMPVRYEVASGGQCRIEATDKAADRVPKKYRLTPEQVAEHPDKDTPPIAHEACETNPIGRGFALAWYLDAARPKQLPAPRTEYPAAPFDAGVFLRAARGKTMPESAGLGFVGRPWMPRRSLVGTIEQKKHWDADEVPQLPRDFDFGYWNGAPADQQCPHLEGTDEARFSLVNLCAHDAPFARMNTDRNTVLKFKLPRQSLFLLTDAPNVPATVHSLAIDTVVIDPEAQRVDLTWRICLPAEGETQAARLLHATEEEQLQRLSAFESNEKSSR